MVDGKLFAWQVVRQTCHCSTASCRTAVACLSHYALCTSPSTRAPSSQRLLSATWVFCLMASSQCSSKCPDCRRQEQLAVDHSNSQLTSQERPLLRQTSVGESPWEWHDRPCRRRHPKIWDLKPARRVDTGIIQGGPKNSHMLFCAPSSNINKLPLGNCKCFFWA